MKAKKRMHENVKRLRASFGIDIHVPWLLVIDRDCIAVGFLFESPPMWKVFRP